jgi:hypothetical protein
MGGDGRRNIPPLHFLLEFNLLAHYVREKNTPQIYVPLSLSYTI